MIRLWIYGLLAVLGALPLPGAGAPVDKPGLRVAVDVGHTEDAPGARSARGRDELDFNRAFAHALVAALQTLGLDAVLINADGRIGGLRERPLQAAQAGAVLLVSIHHDSVSEHELLAWQWAGRTEHYNDQWSGHSLFVSRENPDTARSVLCARVMGARLQRSGFQPTHKNGRRRDYADAAHAVHYYDRLAVLRHAQMPAVLFEAGVIRHREEELLLSDARRQARMADALATAIAACLQAGRPADDEHTADTRPADRPAREAAD